jgi:hypothetical protein
VARMLFRGIYFPSMSAGAWLRLLAANAGTIGRMVARRLLFPVVESAPKARPAGDIGVCGLPPSISDPTERRSGHRPQVEGEAPGQPSQSAAG